MCNSSGTPDVTGKLTPLGNCVTEVDRENERVRVTLKPASGVTLRHSVDVDSDNNVVVEFWRGKRVPRLNEEITHNGKSVEVVGVQLDPDGSVWVTGDNGERFRYE